VVPVGIRERQEEEKMMQLWKYFFDFFFGPVMPQEVDSVQHLEKCLELDQPIIIHTLSKIEEDSE
jgi:hypothetical protein